MNAEVRITGKTQRLGTQRAAAHEADKLSALVLRHLLHVLLHLLHLVLLARSSYSSARTLLAFW